MYCSKQQSRTIFSLIDIKNCQKCKKINHDQEIIICEKRIPIYYIFECSYLEDDILFNIKILYILKEVINADIILWFESYYEFSKFYEVIEVIADYFPQIVIIITK